MLWAIAATVALGLALGARLRGAALALASLATAAAVLVAALVSGWSLVATICWTFSLLFTLQSAYLVGTCLAGSKRQQD